MPPSGMKDNITAFLPVSDLNEKQGMHIIFVDGKEIE